VLDGGHSGGHNDIVRAMAWSPSAGSLHPAGAHPVTGAEDSRVCVWGDAGAVQAAAAAAAAQGGGYAGGKSGRGGAGDGEGGRGDRRHSPY
jgi:hypothetical protein